jgi:hypothetical protein
MARPANEIAVTGRRDIEMQASDRERHMRELAARLLFDVQKRGTRFTLARTVDVPEPVRHDDLTLDEAEEILNTWKLRGPHGG